MEFKYYSKKEIIFFLENNQLQINKRLGQNFLLNAGVIDTIIKNLDLTPQSLIIEIGCGLGSLTHKLIATGCQVIGFEIDRSYVKLLNEQFNAFSNFKLLEGDFLKQFEQLKKRLSPQQEIIFVGNLPYYITTPILEKIFTSSLSFSKACFMVQKEVAQRIIAREGNKQYGSLSIFCQFYSDVRTIAEVSARSFYPRPRVDSSVVLFKQSDSYRVHNRELFFKLAHSMFINRRKQLKNNLALSPLLKDIAQEKLFKALENSGIALSERGENLSIKSLIGLSDELDKILKSTSHIH